MKIEFFTPNPGCFIGTTFFRELDSDKYIPIEQMDINKQKLIFNLFVDNIDTRKYITYLRSTGINNISELLSRVIAKFFPKLDHTWDIDETKLNFEITKH